MNKKALIVLGGIILIFIAYVAFTGSSSRSLSSTQPTVSIPAQQTTNAPSGSTPQQTLSQDPQDIVPGLYPNPIKNTSTQEGFKITSIMVENNTDASGSPVSDHLQLTLENLTNTDLSNFEVYYTITDISANKKEGYYKKLIGYVLKAGAIQTIDFDNKQGKGHFAVNTHSLYFTSTNKLQFTISVSTPGYKLETANVAKAAGGAETKD